MRHRGDHVTTDANRAEAATSAAAARLEITAPCTAAEARGRAIALYVREASAETPDCLERAARTMFRLGFDLPAEVEASPAG
jgi:hypothetical protein